MTAAVFNQGNQAKFSAPTTKGTYRREHLLQKLHDRGDAVISWISAPAGSGKTTLVASYVAERDTPCLWYQLDSDDADPCEFFYFLGRAALTITPEAAELPRLTPELLPSLDSFARRFFRQLFALIPGGACIVFDDYHVVPEQSPVHGLLQQGIEQASHSIHPIFLSRADPPAPFARLLLSQRMRVLGWPDLRFVYKELQGLCELLQIDGLDNQKLSWLEQISDGWAAGLVLLIRNIDKGDASSEALNPVNRQLIFDYFANELFDKAPLETQQLMLQSAMLPYLDPAVVAALTGNPDADRELLKLSRTHSFTDCLSGDPVRYRYHPLFREFLLTRAKSAYTAEQRSAQLERAAALLNDQGDVGSAMSLLFQAKSYKAAARLLIEEASDFVISGRYSRLAFWLEQLPQELCENSPWLQYWRGMVELARSPLDAKHLFERAYRLAQRQEDKEAAFINLCGLLDAIAYSWDDVLCAPPVIEWFDTAVRHLGRDLSREEDERWVVPVIWVDLCLGLADQSPTCNKMAQRAMHTAMRIASSAADSRYKPLLNTYISWHYFHRGEWVKMRETLALLGGTKSTSMDLPTAVHTSFLNGYLRHMAGMPNESRRFAEMTRSLIERTGAEVFNTIACAQECYWYIETNDDEGLERALSKFGELVNNNRRVDLAHYHYLTAWLALERKQPEKAALHAQSAADLTQAVGARWAWQVCSVLLAAAFISLENYDAARATVGQVLTNGSRQGNRQPYLLCQLQLSFLEFKLGSKEKCLFHLRLMLEEGLDAGFSFIPVSHRSMLEPLFAVAHTEGLYPEYVARLSKNHKLPPPAAIAAENAFPWQIEIRTFGGFELWRDGQRHSLNRQPARLLKVLIALGGRDVPKFKLMDCLWPDSDGDFAAGNLKVNLHRLRTALGKDVVSVQNSKISLALDRVWVDLFALNDLVALQKRCPEKGLAAAIDELNSGEFLENEQDESWLLPIRQKLLHQLSTNTAAEQVTGCRLR